MMKICVLQADYGSSKVDYQYFDPKRDLSGLIPDAHFDHVFLNKLTCYRQLKELSYQQYDIFVNLCEGYLEWDIPSIDVIYSLELLDLPFTGPTTKLYDPPKDLMKYVAYCEGIKTPAYLKINRQADIQKIVDTLRFPMFVKPLKAGDSLGIDDHSKVNDVNALKNKINALLLEYDDILIEEYIDGREFTVLVAGNSDHEKECICYQPVEYIFPEHFEFKTYALKTSELHPESNKVCEDSYLNEALKNAASRIFKAFNGVGYGRLDFRVTPQGEIYFLEINFTCSVFYSDGYEGSADYILKFDGIGQSGFLRHIIEEGIARHKRKTKRYEMQGNAISGFGIYAKSAYTNGEIIFRGEERAQRIVTKRFVNQHWNESDQRYFRQYAYPLSDEVYCLWDEEPTEWAPQNHSCEPNTRYDGLNVIAIRDIAPHEELTLDYSDFLDDQAEAFNCRCNSVHCKGMIRGVKNNSVTSREQKANTQNT